MSHSTNEPSDDDVPTERPRPSWGHPGPAEPSEPTTVLPAAEPGRSDFGQTDGGQLGSGRPASSGPSFGQPSSGQPSYGQPAPNQPSYGQPAPAQPSYGQPAPSPSAYGQPGSDQSPYGQPGQQPFGSTSSGPSRGEPTSWGASSGAPSSGTPSGSTSSGSTPSGGTPSGGTPSGAPHGWPQQGQPQQAWGQPTPSQQPPYGQQAPGWPQGGAPGAPGWGPTASQYGQDLGRHEQAYAQMYGEKPRTGASITAMVLGILALLVCWAPIGSYLGILLAVLAVIFGIVGMRRHGGRGMAIAGLVLGGIALVVAVIASIFWTRIGLDFVRIASECEDQTGRTSGPAFERCVNDRSENYSPF